MKVEDVALAQRVKAALCRDRRISNCHIKVIAKEGVVYLRGKVDSGEQKDEAEHIACGSLGVKLVVNELILISGEN